MKAKALLCALIYLMTTTSIFGACVFSSTKMGDNSPIIIEQYGQQSPDIPRGPVFNPFTAYRMNNTVVLESDTSYGQVSITLVSTVGDYITTVFDTADSSILIPISGNAGNYTLLLTDSTGAQFIGTFEI